MDQKQFFHIALTFIPNVGPKLARMLVSYCGGPEAVFRERPRQLARIPGIGHKIARSIRDQGFFSRVEQECEFVERHGIRTCFYLEEDYPRRLRVFDFSPVLFYFMGNGSADTDRMVGIVGTRSPSREGRDIASAIVGGLREYNVTVVSGLAYGIDICAHRKCVESGIPTIAVLGSGLDRIYPQDHRRTAAEMMEKGGLLTEFPSGTGPDRENFPMRNRILAAMIDALLVVESRERGGSMITANFSFDYSRDVFAVPGRPDDELSAGPNLLIRQNKAALIHNADHLADAMMWEKGDRVPVAKQASLFPELEGDEKAVADLLKENDLMPLDEIIVKSGLSPGKLAGTLLHLEFKGVIRALPGNTYKINM